MHDSYTVSILVAGIGALFAALGKVALELLRRGDKAHADIVALWAERLEDSEARADEWRQLAHEERDVTGQAVSIAAGNASREVKP
jgi:hypothetical protein